MTKKDLERLLQKEEKKSKSKMIKHILKQAEYLHIKYKLIRHYKDEFIIRLSYKNRTTYLKNSLFHRNINVIETRAVQDKHLTSLILGQKGLKVNRGFLIDKFSELKPALKKNHINFPIVIKPNTMLQGIGVYVNVQNLTEARKAIEKINKKNRKNGSILVEELYPVKTDYRVLVLDNKVIAVLQRIKPQIVGDGKSTVQQLINRQINKKETKLKIDWETTRTLKKQKVTTRTVLPKGKVIYLRSNHNISSGGIGVNCTDKICPKFKKIAVQAAKEFNMRLAGLDFMCSTDISDPKSDYRIIEINHNPACSYVHDAPDVGKSENTVRQILHAILIK